MIDEHTDPGFDPDLGDPEDILYPVAVKPAPLTLTAGQQKALDDFLAFLMDPLQVAFVLEGYAGT